MDVDPVGIRLILRRRCLNDRVENGLLARKVIVERGSLDADRLRDLASKMMNTDYGRYLMSVAQSGGES